MKCKIAGYVQWIKYLAMIKNEISSVKKTDLIFKVTFQLFEIKFLVSEAE